MKIRCIAIHFALSSVLVSQSGGAFGQTASCPAFTATATTLFLVLVPQMDGSTATVSVFKRATPQLPWRKQGPSRLASLGSKGAAWHATFQGDAPAGARIKLEGDGRTPLGLFPIGASFGRGAQKTGGVEHLDLRQQDLACVDDLRSGAYGQIVPRSGLPAGTRHENMPQETLYRRGLVIAAPAIAASKTGSCIFFHVWRGEGRPTAGCVALNEADVAHLQSQANVGGVVAVLPRSALHRYSACLPSSAD